MPNPFVPIATTYSYKIFDSPDDPIIADNSYLRYRRQFRILSIFESFNCVGSAAFGKNNTDYTHVIFEATRCMQKGTFRKIDKLVRDYIRECRAEDSRNDFLKKF